MSVDTVAHHPAPSRHDPPPPSPQAERDVFTAPGTHGRSALRRLVDRLGWPLGVYTTPLALLVLWQALSGFGWLPSEFAPAPTAIVASGYDRYSSGQLLPSLAVSLRRAGTGLLLGLTVGLVAGAVGGLLRSGEHLLNGVFQILNTIPLLAILPLMIVWFGIDELTKVLLISFGAAVPMYLNLFAAIRGVDQRLVEMARTAGAGRWRVVTAVLLPGSLPGFLVGLRFALAYSILGLVAAELVNADQGIGFLINRAQTYLNIEQVFVGLAVYAALGLLADQAVRLLERLLLGWRPSYEAP